MIGGTDVTFEVHAHGASVATILHACRLYWPECLYQDANEVEAHPVDDVIGRELDQRIDPEFFIYKNRKSFDIWKTDGASAANEDTMVHFIITDIATEASPYFQVTMVSDHRSTEIRDLEIFVRFFLEPPYVYCHIADLPDRLQAKDRYCRLAFLTKSEVLNALMSMDYPEFQSAAVSTGRPVPEELAISVAELEQAVAETYLRYSPKPHLTDILLNPPSGMQFCEKVRKRLGRPIPDSWIMHTLLFSRKRPSP